MAVPSRSGFRAAIGSYADIVTTAGAMPGTYIALFLIGAAQGFVYASVDKTVKLAGQYTNDMLIGDIFSFAAALVLIPFGVGLLRHFTRAVPAYPSNLALICLRLIGWSILVGVLYIIAIVGIAVVSGVVAAFSQDMPALVAIGLVVLAIALFVLIWIGLRLALFYPIIARGEPSPLSGSFRQTKGFAFFVFRTWFFAILIGIPLFAAFLALQLPVFGISLENLWSENINDALKPMLAPQPLGRSALLAVFSGVATIIAVVFYTAIQGRIFRVVRGLE